MGIIRILVDALFETLNNQYEKLLLFVIYFIKSKCMISDDIRGELGGRMHGSPVLVL